ncbi:MAG: toprim domain-containing protein, partial [Candidatus Brocadiales bacterium]
RSSILKDRKALIMEGYTDVIMAHQEGISNTVGVLGTALTVEHIRLLRQWTPEVVLVLDGDTAGKKSSDRSLDILVEEEIEAKVVQLPEANDPCDFILREGADKFMELVEEALDFFSFKMQMAEAKRDLSSPSGKLAAIRELLYTVLRIPNELRRQLIIKNIAEKMSVEEETLRRELGRLKFSGAPRTADVGVHVKAVFDADYRAEKELLSLLLSHNELIEEFESEIGPEAFESQSLKEIACKALEIYRANGHVTEVDLVQFFVEGEPAKALADITLEDKKGDYRELFATWIHYIKRREEKKKIGYTRKRIENLDGNQKKEEARLLMEFHEKAKLTHLSQKRTR